MSEQKKEPSGPDLTAGVSAAALRKEGQILGHVGKDDVLVVQVGHEILAVGARCTHYRGPLAEGLVVGDTVRCPWHHACFSLRTGEHLRAPALDPIACWRVEQTGDRIVVKEKLPPSTRERASRSAGVDSDCWRRSGRNRRRRHIAPRRVRRSAHPGQR